MTGEIDLAQSWLNPEYAAQQIALLGMIFLVSLVVLPVVLGALVYGVLSLVARRTRNVNYTNRRGVS